MFFRRKKEKVPKTPTQPININEVVNAQLYKAAPGSKWRWVWKPADFESKGGIARLEVMDPGGDTRFLDNCITIEGGRVCNATLIDVSVTNHTAYAVTDNALIESGDETTDVKISQAGDTASPTMLLTTEDNVIRWFNVILYDDLSALITDLNAQDETCLTIADDGKVRTGVKKSESIIKDFGKMPTRNLWNVIIDKLIIAGLFSEERDEGLFVCWAY